MINHVFHWWSFGEEKRNETSGARLNNYDIFNISFSILFFKIKLERKEAIL